MSSIVAGPTTLVSQTVRINRRFDEGEVGQDAVEVGVGAGHGVWWSWTATPQLNMRSSLKNDYSESIVEGVAVLAAALPHEEIFQDASAWRSKRSMNSPTPPWGRWTPVFKQQ